MDTQSINFAMDNVRKAIKAMVGEVNGTKVLVIKGDEQQGQNKGEIIANIQLGIRHLEDAAMRFGKAIQAASGGESPLGGPDTPGTPVQQ